MQSLSVFSNTTKIADFRVKKCCSHTVQGEWYVIYIFFGSSLGKV